MRGRRTTGTVAVVVGVLFAGSCGGDDDTGSPEPAVTTPDGDGTSDETGDESSDEPSDEVEAPDDAPAVAEDPSSSGVPVPIGRFTVAGPGDANTIAPSCARDVELQHSEMFRLRMPEGWSWSGFSGGSAWDEITLIAGDGTDVRVLEVATQSEVPLDLVVGQPIGTDIDLDGTTVPLVEIEYEGRTGFGFVDLPYLEPFPLSAGAAMATVALISDVDGRPTVDEAVEVLSTVRIERCEAVSLAQIYGPAAGVHLVPRFEPDPLGKTYPEEPQPTYEPGRSPLAAYSTAQIAYLMPVPAEIAECAAEQAAGLADDPIGYLLAFRPTGTAFEDFDALLAPCT